MREKDTLVKRVSFFIFPNFFARGNSFSNYKYENLLRGEGARSVRRPLSPRAPHRATRKKQQMFERINIVAPLIGYAERNAYRWCFFILS